MVFITSSVSVVRRDVEGVGQDAEPHSEHVQVIVSPAAGDKCERCWRFTTDVRIDGAAAGLCGRCAAAVGDAFGS
jgi:isoleucyl-tRNA synthetase